MLAQELDLFTYGLCTVSKDSEYRISLFGLFVASQSADGLLGNMDRPLRIRLFLSRLSMIPILASIFKKKQRRGPVNEAEERLAIGQVLPSIVRDRIRCECVGNTYIVKDRYDVHWESE